MSAITPGTPVALQRRPTYSEWCFLRWDAAQPGDYGVVLGVRAHAEHPTAEVMLVGHAAPLTFLFEELQPYPLNPPPETP